MERQLKERRVHTLAHHGHQRIGVRRSLPAVLPEGWTLENLLADHASTPYNPALANAFVRAGEIETWGRGIQRIFEACENAGTPAPHRGLHGGRITQSPFGKKINHREHREHRERKKPKADSL
jgi:predicted HTH transcriptional regulator